MPKFDSVIVAPRNSSGGIERACASARIRSSPARRSLASRSPTLRKTGTIRPPSVSTAIPRSMRLMTRREPASELYQALSDGSAAHAAAIARTIRIVTSSPLRQSLMSASSVTVVRATSACAAALRGRHLDNGLVGLDRNERLVDDDVIALIHMPADDLRFLEAFANIGK